MWIGVGRIVLDFYNNDDAGLKARKLKELCDGLRKKFNVSALEVDDIDDPERCVIGFAAVMPAGWKEPSARSLVDRIAKEIDETSVARVMIEDTDLYFHGKGDED